MDTKPNLPPEHPLANVLNESSGPWVTLTGYFGPSPKKDYHRLYLGMDFHQTYYKTYYEIPDKAILHFMPVDPKDENSPVHLFVEAGAEIELVSRGPASYLQGSIASKYLAGAASPLSQGQTAPEYKMTTIYWGCSIHTFMCPMVKQAALGQICQWHSVAAHAGENAILMTHGCTGFITHPTSPFYC
jgi:hypothetical protein